MVCDEVASEKQCFAKNIRGHSQSRHSGRSGSTAANMRPSSGNGSCFTRGIQCTAAHCSVSKQLTFEGTFVPSYESTFVL